MGAVLALVGASFLGALTSVALGPFLPVIAGDLRTPVPLLGQTATAAPFGAGVAVVCITLASFLAPFGWVTLVAMLSGETPAGQATTMVLAVSVYSLGAAIGGAAGGCSPGADTWRLE